MPTKLNSAGNQQNYIAKGNGIHSGEYTYDSVNSEEYIKKYSNSSISYKATKKNNFNIIPHISTKNSDIIDDVIRILEENNTPDIEGFLDNFYVYNEFQVFGREYKLKDCASIQDLKNYISKFYEKYPLQELQSCLKILESETDTNYHHYYGVKYIEGSHTINDDVKLCNPNYKYDSDDGAYRRNCLNCVLAMEMRTRNLDVEAKGWDGTSYDSDFKKLFKVFDGLTRFSFKNDSHNNAIKTKLDYISERYENARLIFTIKYKYNWHAIVLVVNNHKLEFYDPQCGKDLHYNFYEQANIYEFEYARIDDISIKNREAKKYIQGRKDKK